MTPPAPGLRRYALALLLAVNLLNYVDRQVLYAVFPLIKADLGLTDTELGFLGSSFMLCYMTIAPLFGWLGDRGRRTRLAAFGLAVWSAATALAGSAGSYRTLLAARTAVGVGEASFGTVSPGLVADYFPRERRGRAMSLFYLAIPVGSALGYLLGGLAGGRWGWHTAFLLVGLPGLLLVPPLLLLREPPRGGTEFSSPAAGAAPRYRDLLRNRSFVVNTLAMAAMTFALGGLAQWLPTFLYRLHGLDVARANTVFGAITVLAGIVGTAAGGWLGDRWQRRSPRGYLLVSAVGFLVGAPLTAAAILAPSTPACLALTFCAETFLFLNTGPLNTVIVTVTGPAVRSMAFAVNIFCIHALGDAVSPTVIGWLSDRWGLRAGLMLTPAAVLLAAVLCLWCGRYMAADARAAGEGP